MSYRKLTDEARRQIRQAYSTGTTQKELAEFFQVSQSCIAATVNEERHLLSVIRSARRRLKRLRAGTVVAGAVRAELSSDRRVAELRQGRAPLRESD